MSLLSVLVLIGCDDSKPDGDVSSTSKESHGDSSSPTQDSTSSLAYNFKMQNLNGEELQLSDLTGKPIVLNFWASWCPPCKAEMPDFESAFNKHKDTVTFVMVSVDDTLEDAKDFYEGSGYTFPAYFDSLGEGSYIYGISSIPQSFFISADGKIISSHTGMISAAQLENGINELLK